MTDFNFNELEKDTQTRMNKALKALENEFSGIRAGRASNNLLDSITADVYGSKMALNQLASVSVLDARTLSVHVWDKSNASAVEKAIRESRLGLNPQSEGQLLRIPIPPLSEERRIELTKITAKYAEECKISIRKIRRDANEKLKNNEKNSAITKDEHKKYSENIQKITNDFTNEVEQHLKAKNKDITSL